MNRQIITQYFFASSPLYLEFFFCVCGLLVHIYESLTPFNAVLIPRFWFAVNWTDKILGRDDFIYCNDCANFTETNKVAAFTSHPLI